jgi:hypothetical protein
MSTTDAMLPGLKERLRLFEDVAMSLRNKGEIDDLEELGIEKDARWITKRLSIVRDDLTPYNRQIEDVRAESPVYKRPRTEDAVIGRRSLGMRYRRS